MEAVKVSENGKAEVKTPQLPVAAIPDETEIQTVPKDSKTSKKWIIRIGFLSVVVLIGLSILWYYSRPTKVVLVQPKQANRNNYQ